MHMIVSRLAGAVTPLNTVLTAASCSGLVCCSKFSTLPFGGRDSDEGTMNKDASRNEVANEAQDGEGSYLHNRDQPLTGGSANNSYKSSITASEADTSSGPAHHRLATAHSGTSLPPDTDVQAAKQNEPQFHGSDEPADHGATIDIRREADVTPSTKASSGAAEGAEVSQSSSNPDMQSQPGDLPQPSAAEADREQDEYQMPQSVNRPDDMPEGTVPPTRGFDQRGMPSRESPTQGQGVVHNGPGTSAGTSGAL